VSITLNESVLQRLDAVTRDEIDSGRLGAAQWAVARHGEIVDHRAYGTATLDDTFVIFSATKTVVSMALLPWLADGTLQLTAPVAAYVDGFGTHGKERTTVLQLLTMQGGFPQAPMDLATFADPAARRARFSTWTLDWPSGTRTEYHPMSAHLVIADIIEQVTGKPFHDVVHDVVVAPAGARRLLGAPASPPVTIRLHGERPGEGDGDELVRFFGRPELVPDITVGPDLLLGLNHPTVQTAALPGGGAITNAADMCRVYQSWLHNTAGLPDAWLQDATKTVRNAGINVSDGAPANRTIAGIVSGHDGHARHRWFPDVPRAFGHHGAGGQLCWLDHDSGISFCFLNDTLQQHPIVEHTRIRAINDVFVS
jgi:CubicO group peptidase (beta-lactamase class C family)